MDLRLSPSEVVVDGQSVAPRGPDAIPRLKSVLGSVVQSTVAGVAGSGRVAHWMSSGVVIVSQSTDQELVCAFVCFDEEDSSPYPKTVPRPPVFRGRVEIDGLVLVGGEQRRALSKDPRISGVGGLLDLRSGDMLVGLTLRKPLNKLGKRQGAQRLVQLSVEWGDVKGFPAKRG